MKKLTIGIIAHVDSGKTTLSEGILYLTKVIRKFGRVDKGASFFDSNSMERKRGITIFSKHVRFTFGNTEFVMLDTPGHADFSAEMERALQVLDYAILLISATDGIKGQTEMLSRLLSEYKIPTFIFFNKMDREGADKLELLHLARGLNLGEVVDFSKENEKNYLEQASLASETAVNEFLETGTVKDETIAKLIADRLLLPCYFGSALKMEGVEELLTGLDKFTLPVLYPEKFSARAFKILYSDDNQRLTFVKITGGSIKAKTLINDGESESKINQIRLYSGDKFSVVNEVGAGEICAFTGLKESFAGEGFGEDKDVILPFLVPILCYRIILKNNEAPVTVLPIFKTLEEENPELKINWDEDKAEISVSVMGEIQLEILQTQLKERFNLEVEFDEGEVIYKETITKPIVGVGHFEPLRHYAEVHVLMEPLPLGSGIVVESNLSTDKLSKNWQRLIKTNLLEKQHRGVLTGAPITDIKLTIVAGKAHLKHTEGGDFRQASYRAVRQGLMMTESKLLEPYFRFLITLPTENVGKALNDLNLMNAEFGQPELDSEKNYSYIRGRGPVSVLRNYQKEISSYTKGLGHISFVADGFGDCHNEEEVIFAKGYDPLRDTRNPCDSVFCARGAGHIVPYDEVYEHMHLAFNKESNSYEDKTLTPVKRQHIEIALGTDEIEMIINGFSSSNSKSKKGKSKWKKNFGDYGSSTESFVKNSSSKAALKNKQPESVIPKTNLFSFSDSDKIIVDGYNVIFAWPELKELAHSNLDAACDSLVETLSKYQAVIKGEITVVFDAYRVKGHATEKKTLGGVKIIYTKEDQTADQYIERLTNSLAKKEKVSVVTNDGPERLITIGHGCRLISSEYFKTKIESAFKTLNEKYGVR